MRFKVDRLRKLREEITGERYALGAGTSTLWQILVSNGVVFLNCEGDSGQRTDFGANEQ